MKVTKRVLANIQDVYAVSAATYGGQTHLLAASEAHGPCVMFSPPEWTQSPIWQGPGGCMELFPLPGDKPALLAIDHFFPIFKSENAGIVYAEAGDPWRVRRVLDLPFVHRFEVVDLGGERQIVAGCLCAAKAFQDDWSQPGAVYAGKVPERPDMPWSVEPILTGLSKNHGLHQCELGGRKTILVGAQEGLFALRVPSVGDRWESEQLLKHEVSDVWAYDLDGDGKSEFAVIEPFHGNRLTVYKEIDGALESVFADAMEFGHVVWAGEIRGESCIIAGSREGNKELVLYRRTTEFEFERTVMDSGVGAAQISVVHRPDADLVLSANHAVGEVVLYEIR